MYTGKQCKLETPGGRCRECRVNVIKLWSSEEVEFFLYVIQELVVLKVVFYCCAVGGYAYRVNVETDGFVDVFIVLAALSTCRV